MRARGLPRDAIRFIHDAKTDRDKGELFAACRAGTVAVLIGSTEKMGVGTNVQFRAIALHHLDCPWRPADVARAIELARLAFQLRWSAWRRRHQARARWHHYAARMAIHATRPATAGRR